MSAAPSPQVPDVYMEVPDPEVVAFQQHQKTAVRLSPAEDCRTMINLASFGVLATISSREEAAGYPQGSVVEFASDASGRPVFATSSLSPHTKDLSEDGRISLTVMATNFHGVQDSRATLQGRVRPVTDDEKPVLRDLFLKKYPDAFWVDFSDFRWFIMEEILAVRYNGGFALAKKLTKDEYMAAKPDPVAQFSAPVCSHMNDDHGADTIAMIKHYTGLSVDSATLLDLDRLGLNIEVKRKGSKFKLRLPFVTPAADRKGIKETIVEMTKAARSSTASTPAQ